MDRRQEFLVEFLGALGAREIRFSRVEPESIAGTVVYDPADPEEEQDFRWCVGTAPSPAAKQLAALIREERLLRGDKLVATREELLSRFNNASANNLEPWQLDAALDELLQVQVPMLDDGVESDCYFVHE